MRRGRVEHAQQHSKAFGQGHQTIGRVVALEVFQRIEHLHSARDDRVVLHALVVVIHLFEHGMHFQTQHLGLFRKRHRCHTTVRRQDRVRIC